MNIYALMKLAAASAEPSPRARKRVGAFTTRSWSSRRGRLDDVTEPMTPAPATETGKEPPCAA